MLKRFGEFELDEGTRRLTRGGLPVRLTGQALELLFLLVSRPRELISREEVRQHLWPASGADLEHSLDVLLNRLRVIMGDSGRIPRYIETVPRKGYRFLADIECAQSPGKQQRINTVRRLWTYAVIALLAAAITILIARTRYKRFVPSGTTPTSVNPHAVNDVRVHLPHKRSNAKKDMAGARHSS